MEARDRAAARALLLTPSREVLLMLLDLGPERRVWVTPGGGIEAGEHPHEAAVREVFEETGRRVQPRQPVWRRTHTFELEGQLITQRETYFLAPTSRFEPRTEGLESIERRWFRGFRWWHVEAIRASDELFSPRRLGDLLVELLRQGPPPSPIDAGV